MSNFVGVILVNYGGFEFTQKCVESILNTKYKELTVYIVENGSNVEEKKKIVSLVKKYRNLCLIDLRDNCGYSKANRLGMERAIDDGCEYLWILNNDTLVAKESVEIMVDLYKKKRLTKSNTLVSSIVTFDDGKRIWSNGIYDLPLVNFPKSRDKYRLVKDAVLKEKEVIKSQYVSSCSVMVHRDFCIKHGLFPDDYFIYYDDLDWTSRGTNWVIQKPLVKHLVSATGGISGSDRFTPFKAYWYGKNSIKFYFFRKLIPWYEKVIFLSFTLSVMVGLYVRDLKSLSAFVGGVGDGLWQKK